VNQQGIALKNPTGWFAAGREVARAMVLLSDGAFKLYMYLCLTADRTNGRLKIDQGQLAAALKKSRRSVVSYLDELRAHQICIMEPALNQHVVGHIEVCDRFWPYVKSRRDEDGADTLDSYIEAIRQFLAARKCVNPVFNPSDEKIAAQMFRERVELQQIDRAVLLACARRYVALLNGTVIGQVAGLSYFKSAIQEVRSLNTPAGYWQHLASRVTQFERQWANKAG
jgi:hypothetical protein